jgi:hypothetical protein
VDFTGTLVGQFALGEMVGNRSRVQLMQAGTFNHARFGEFTITDEHLRGFADSIKRKGDRVSIDYDHSFAENGDSRAAGWIDGQTVEVQGDSLFAEVDWTPPAADAIRNREYRFISPEFDFTTRDYRSGERVELPDFKAAALTNRPFLKEMTPVTLSEGSFLDVLDTYLLDEEQVEAAAHRYGADVAASLKTAAMHGPSNADREAARRVLASTTNKETSMNLRELAASLGLSEDADEATILAAARDAASRSPPSPPTATPQRVAVSGVTKAIAAASLGAGARVAVGSTNGVLIPIGASNIASSANGSGLRYVVGRALKNAVAGDVFPGADPARADRLAAPHRAPSPASDPGVQPASLHRKEPRWHLLPRRRWGTSTSTPPCRTSPASTGRSSPASSRPRSARSCP